VLVLVGHRRIEENVEQPFDGWMTGRWRRRHLPPCIRDEVSRHRCRAAWSGVGEDGQGRSRQGEFGFGTRRRQRGAEVGESEQENEQEDIVSCFYHGDAEATEHQKYWFGGIPSHRYSRIVLCGLGGSFQTPGSGGAVRGDEPERRIRNDERPRPRARRRHRAPASSGCSTTWRWTTGRSRSRPGRR